MFRDRRHPRKSWTRSSVSPWRLQGKAVRDRRWGPRSWSVTPENVLDHSRQFVLNPFHGHNEAERQITDVGIRGHIKEFAQLDGAFIVTGDGVVEAAGRYITVDVSQVNLPGGLGSRHSSVAGITMVTRSIGVVVSQSGGLITIFRDGKIVYTMKW